MARGCLGLQLRREREQRAGYAALHPMPSRTAAARE